MIADLFDVRQTGDRGFGLFARVAIPKGTLIDYHCDLCERICGRADLERMGYDRRQQIMEHTYTTGEGDVILDCSIGRYMNHSCAANALEAYGDFDVAVRDIAEGEEITCDYRQFNDPDDGFPCHCGEPSCCSIVSPLGPFPPRLEDSWREQTEAACKALMMPPRFTTGIGADKITLGTWRPPQRGQLWEPVGLAPSAPVVRRISQRLNVAGAAPADASVEAERRALSG